MSFEEILGELVEGFAPDLPFVVAGVGVEFYFYAGVLHYLDNVAGVVDAGILLAAAQEEYVKLLVEVVGVGKYAWAFCL